MSDNTTEELIIRWMDGEQMTEDQINTLKKIHADEPEMILNPTEFSEIRTGLRESFPSDQDLPNGDLFTTSLLSRLEYEQEHASQLDNLEGKILNLEDEKSKIIAKDKAEKFTWKHLVGAMAACFLFGLLLNATFFGNKGSDEPVIAATPTFTEVDLSPVVYSARQDLSADYHSDGQTNVIVVEGLTAIPDEIDLFGLAKVNTPIKVVPNKTYPIDETN